MMDGLHAAYSGLVAYGRKTSVSGHNLANAETRNFKKNRLILETQNGGGVTTQLEGPDSNQNPTPPVEEVKQSETTGVDLGEEMVQLTTSQRAFEANAESMKTQNEVLGTLVDIMA